MKELLLYSGGMDSLIAWQVLDRPPTLYADLRHRYVMKELLAINNTIPDTKITSALDLSEYEKADAEIPARNLLLCTVAAQEGANIIHLITQKDEMSIPDRTLGFMKSASNLLSTLFGRSIEITTPFSKIDKTDMVEVYVRGGGSIELLLNTVGCYAAEHGHCGDCSACLRRYIALMNNDINPGYSLSNAIRDKYRNKLHTYSELRQKRMKPWL